MFLILRENYTVTDKADGEKKFIVCFFNWTYVF